MYYCNNTIATTVKQLEKEGKTEKEMFDSLSIRPVSRVPWCKGVRRKKNKGEEGLKAFFVTGEEML